MTAQMRNAPRCDRSPVPQPLASRTDLRARAMEAHYRAAKLGLVVMAPDSSWVFLDERARELMSRIRGFDHSRTFAEILDPDSGTRLVSAIRDLVAGLTSTAQLEFDVGTTARSVARLAAQLTTWNEPQFKGSRVIAAVGDVTAQAYYDFQRRREEKRLRATVDNAAVGMICTDWNGSFLEVNRQFARMLDYAPSELLGRDFREFMVAEDLTPHTKRRAALWRGEIDSVVIDRRWHRRDGATIWTRLTISIQDDLCDSEPYSVVIVEDITEAKKVAESQRLLVSELNHRVKNTLAIVQGIVRRTLVNAESPDAFATQIEARLASVSRAHDLLARNDWQRLTLREIVDEALLSTFCGHRESFHVAVDATPLSPHQAITLALILHELATNALKYGSLSQRAGSVQVTSELTPPKAPDEARQLCLRWIERGGPTPLIPAHQGFGSFLLKRGAGHALNGNAKLNFAPEGFELTLTFPVIETLFMPTTETAQLAHNATTEDSRAA